MGIRVLVVATIVLPLAGCRLTFWEADTPAADRCAEPNATATRLLKDEDPANDVIAYRVIINAKTCFDAELLAMAQELLERSRSSATS